MATLLVALSGVVSLFALALVTDWSDPVARSAIISTLTLEISIGALWHLLSVDKGTSHVQVDKKSPEMLPAV